MSKKKGSAPDEMQQCADILKFISAKPDAYPFLEPVDWENLNLPDYPEIIKHPMDLGTVEQSLQNGEYKDADKFASEVRLVWRNAMKYNRENSDIYIAADTLSKQFEKKFSKIKRTGKRKRDPTREVTRVDRVKFSQLVNQLSSEQLGHMVGLIQKNCPEALNEEDDDELEIEINNIDPSTLLQLNDYAQNCIGTNSSNKKRKRSQ